MASENKTKPTAVSVDEYLEWIEPEQRREDAKALDRLMRRITGAAPTMWGPSIIGYGKSHYKYASGREGNMPLAANTYHEDMAPRSSLPGMPWGLSFHNVFMAWRTVACVL